MGVNYTLPPWLNPSAAQGWGQLHAAGSRAGVALALDRQRMAQQLAMERQRMAQQAMQFNAQMQQREQEMAARTQAAQQSVEQDYLRRQQEMEMAKAESAAQFGLKTRALDMEQKKIDSSIKMAASSFQAQEQIRRRIAAGEDPAAVYRELGPMAGMSSGALAPLLRQQEDISPKPFSIPLPSGQVAEGVYNPASGAPHIVRPAEVPPQFTEPEAVKTPDGEIIGWRVPTVKGTSLRAPPRQSASDAVLKNLFADEEEEAEPPKSRFKIIEVK